jgi:hypothetical protein
VQNKKRLGCWHLVVHEGATMALRVLSLVFSACSAISIYWFFGVLWDGYWGHMATVGMTAAFIILGYFVTRNIAYRMRTKKKVRTYAFLLALYLLVEVSANFGHALARYPDVTWLHVLHGWQYLLFSLDVPVVFSILPLFNIALARVDVDAMEEQGALQAAPAAPKQAAFSSGGSPSAVASQTQPQAQYPPAPPPMQSRPNNLKNHLQGLPTQQVGPMTQMAATNSNGTSWTH